MFKERASSYVPWTPENETIRLTSIWGNKCIYCRLLRFKKRGKPWLHWPLKSGLKSWQAKTITSGPSLKAYPNNRVLWRTSKDCTCKISHIMICTWNWPTSVWAQPWMFWRWNDVDAAWHDLVVQVGAFALLQDSCTLFCSCHGNEDCLNVQTK